MGDISSPGKTKSQHSTRKAGGVSKIIEGRSHWFSIPTRTGTTSSHPDGSDQNPLTSTPNGTSKMSLILRKVITLKLVILVNYNFGIIKQIFWSVWRQTNNSCSKYSHIERFHINRYLIIFIWRKVQVGCVYTYVQEVLCRALLIRQLIEHSRRVSSYFRYQARMEI